MPCSRKSGQSLSVAWFALACERDEIVNHRSRLPRKMHQTWKPRDERLEWKLLACKWAHFEQKFRRQLHIHLHHQNSGRCWRWFDAGKGEAAEERDRTGRKCRWSSAGGVGCWDYVEGQRWLALVFSHKSNPKPQTCSQKHHKSAINKPPLIRNVWFHRCIEW